MKNCAGGTCRSRPKLKLKIGCLQSGFAVRLGGKDADEVESVRNKIGGRRATALVTMLDGRRTTVTEKTPRC
jgi:hypothetical protein